MGSEITIFDLKKALNEILPQLTTHHTTLLTIKSGELVLIGQFASFQEHEPQIQRLAAAHSENHILVTKYLEHLDAYCTLAERNIHFRFKDGKFELYRFSLEEELPLHQQPMMGETLKQQIIGHFKKDRLQRSS